MHSNLLPPERLATLHVGATVLVESCGITAENPEYHTERVTRLTKTRIITTTKAYGQDVEGSYRRSDGAAPGPRQGHRVALVDPDHPDTVQRLGVHCRSVARLRIERLHDEWQQHPEDMEKARELQARIADYLATYDTEETAP